MSDHDWIDQTADTLASLYETKFGGKNSGRFRIATKLVRAAAGRRRIYEKDVNRLTRALFERGFVLIDMDSFFVVMSSNTFINYRRANDDVLK